MFQRKEISKFVLLSTAINGSPCNLP